MISSRIKEEKRKRIYLQDWGWCELFYCCWQGEWWVVSDTGSSPASLFHCQKYQWSHTGPVKHKRESQQNKWLSLDIQTSETSIAIIPISSLSQHCMCLWLWNCPKDALLEFQQSSIDTWTQPCAQNTSAYRACGKDVSDLKPSLLKSRNQKEQIYIPPLPQDSQLLQSCCLFHYHKNS